ncbi:MAG TPA: TIGR03621 family F420-dependent LLM class oxidoreductase [Solirubrobacteraceae bacterium]|jgi:probable F420-dependent oxidoreductase|nr:TIGR03621 family F420-dependent LLM class oxidoreductase [Solirubrobacteraceae bacterium]
MRFGVVVGAPTREGYVEAVRRAEQLGYDVVLCSDHLELEGRHFSHFSPLPALTAAAMVTRRIRIGTSVLNQDFRHPAVLAREAASLDVLSDGRLELGLGMGWNEPEYRMAGIAFDPAPQRLRRLTEYVQVVKGVMAQQAFSFDGEFFTISAMAGEPSPLQRPHPPIMLGATRPRMLALAAREADIVSLSMLQAPDPSAAFLEKMVDQVRAAAGERFAGLELQLPIAATISHHTGGVDAVRAAIAGGEHFISMLASKFGEEALADSPMVLSGTATQMAQQLAGLRARFGIEAVMIPMPQMEALAEVIHELKGAPQ